MAAQYFQIVQADATTPEDFVESVAHYCPRLLAYQKHHMHLDFGPGHLAAIGQIVIDFLLKEDVTRVLSPDYLVDIDSALAEYFDADKGEF